jgi:long-chain fatty acid transport protein
MAFLRRFLCVACTAIALAPTALAGGFQLNEVGARAMGMGGAVVAQANDLSAIYFNPAGLAQLAGFRVSLGGTMILPKSSFTSPAGAATDMVSQTFVTPNVHASYGMDNGLAFGVGFYVPFGLGTEWPATWPGRFVAVKTDLQNFVINPTIAYKVGDSFMIGAGVSYMWSTVKLSYHIGTFSSLGPPPVPSATDGSVSLEADGNGIGFDAGAIYKPVPELSIGASYRHSTKLDLEGTAKFSSMQALTTFFPGGTGKTTIKFPSQIFAGIAYRFSPAVTVELDLQWVGWSSYDTLAVQLPNGPPFPLTGRPLQATSKSGKNWKDATLLRLGGEYLCEAWAFRLGFIYDMTPQPNKTVEPLLPDANRMEGIVGVGYTVAGNWSIDAAYQLILFKDRTVTGPSTGDLNAFPGTYTNSANLFGLSVSYVM